MKNIINEKPNEELSGRLKASVNFVSDDDIYDRNILDIGCGYGWCELNFLTRKVKSITAIDVSDNDLETIRKNVTNDKVAILAASGTNLPFDSDTFDTVVSWEVIEHIPKNDEDQLFSEVARVLKRDGVFYLSTPHNTFFTNFLDPAWLIAGHRHYSENVLEKFAVKHSFRKESAVTLGGWWSLFYILNFYISKWIFRRKPFFDKKFKNEEDIEYMAKKGFANIFIKFRKIS